MHVREAGDARRSRYQSDWVRLVENDVPYALILPLVAATVIWEEADVLAEALEAGKLVAVYGIHPSQRWVSRVCERAGVGIPCLDPTNCTVETLVGSVQQLLQPALRLNAVICTSGSFDLCSAAVVISPMQSPSPPQAQETERFSFADITTAVSIAHDATPFGL